MNPNAPVTRLLAPNPSPLTLEGTNTYLLDGGAGEAIVIDPGPRMPHHIMAIEETLRKRGLRAGAIAVTHGHPDHAPGAALLHELTGAPVYAHAAARFAHDATLGDGESLVVGGARIETIEALGHARDHLVFWWAEHGALFTGDVVIGTGTVVIAPPEGDMRAYQATLRNLRARFGGAERIYGGHGDAIDTPAAKLDQYIAHREAREAAIVEAMAAGARTIPQIVARVYAETPQHLWPAAARQVLAYLIALQQEGRVVRESLARAMEPAERALLNPDLTELADASSRAVAAAELGFDRAVDHVDAYALA